MHVPAFNWHLLPGGVSNVFWHAATPSNSLIVAWENAPVGNDVSSLTNFQIEFFADGRFDYRYQDRTVEYAPVFPFDWDGDGLENSVDPEPLVHGGDFFGTGVEWLNANCGGVLSACAGMNGEAVVTWRTNACEAAYFWLRFTATRDGTRVVLDYDGESNLGDLFVVANSNQTSANPPPFDGESLCPFSVTNSPSADRHLMVPFFSVVQTNDFSVMDFSVDMCLELEPEGTPTSGLMVDWELVEAVPGMSGALVPGAGLSAQFVNPKTGGVYRFRGRCCGSPWTEANIVLPLAGAEVCGVFENDFAIYADVMAALDTGSGQYERQSPLFGLDWFSNGGAADYRGRVDSAAWPTVWRYNQVDDVSGFGAVATLYGIPTRMAKLGSFLAGYGTRRIEVWELSRWASQSIGTGNDATADMSWDAGTDVADGSNAVSTVASLSSNMWYSADMKVKTLWPNPTATDNHLERAGTVNYNRFFRSPQVIEDEVRRRRIPTP